MHKLLPVISAKSFFNTNASVVFYEFEVSNEDLKNTNNKILTETIKITIPDFIDLDYFLNLNLLFAFGLA